MYTTSIIPLVRTLLGEIHKEVCHEKFWQASTARSYFDLRCPSFIINVECMSVCPVSNIKFWCLWFRTKIDNSGKLSDKTGKFHRTLWFICAALNVLNLNSKVQNVSTLYGHKSKWRISNWRGQWFLWDGEEWSDCRWVEKWKMYLLRMILFLLLAYV